MKPRTFEQAMEYLAHLNLQHAPPMSNRKLRHDLDKANAEIEKLRKELANIREVVRGYIFPAAPAPQPAPVVPGPWNPWGPYDHPPIITCQVTGRSFVG